MAQISLTEFAARLASMDADMKTAQEEAVERGARMVAKKAKQLIGKEQPEWPALAESTIEDKRRKGFPVPKPLLRTGEMRDSISSSKAEWEDPQTVVAYAGSTDPKSKFHELGTSKIPPRPFISLAAQGQERVIQEAMAATAMRGILHGPEYHLWRHVFHDLERAYEYAKEIVETDESED